MAKLRLNESMRGSLNRFAEEYVTTPKTTKRREAAYVTALALVSAAVAKENPETDMAVLAKYGHTYNASNVYIMTEAGQFQSFSVTDEGLTVACSNRVRQYVVSARCFNAVEEYAKTVDQENAERNAILTDYRALINGSKYAEEVVEVWPAARSVLEPFFAGVGRSLPATLSSEAMARIAKTNVGAQATT